MNTRRFHAGAVIATAAFAVAALSACGSNSETENVSGSVSPAAAPTSASMSTPENDSTSAAPTTSQAPAETSRAPEARQTGDSSPEAEATPSRQLPTSAGDYSEAFMQAWTGGDKSAMSTYATAGVVDQMASVTPEGALLRTVCEDTMCSYSEENGGRVTLTLDMAKVDSGASQAITGVKVDL